MNPRWRERIFGGVAAALGVWLSIGLADGAIVLPLMFATIALGAIFTRLTSMPIDAVAIAILLFGYVVGNRGFAQLMPVPGLPLLPAEIGLGLSAACLAWRSARDKLLPWRRDALNYALFAWMIVGTARFAFDFPREGFMALRDYATVYYAAFFFITQQLCQDESIRRFLLKALLFTSACLPVVFALFEIFPQFFLGTLLIRGVPLVYFKGDLTPAFLAVGAIALYHCVTARHRWWARTLATVMIVWVFTGDNRASMLGTVVALAWIAVSRYRSFPALQGGVVTLALLLLIAAAGVFNHAWSVVKVRGLADRAVSVVDISGRFSYRQAEGVIKSDNNQFRWVWWRTVATETMAVNPVLGLGFGYDLARGFLQEYNPDLAEDFTTRSPHNIIVTALGRMGLVGFTIFVWMLALLALRTWRVMRDPASDATQVALWAGLWPILISAHLGVVLEGPMGAVVFWSLLGLAHAYRPRKQEAEIPAGESADPLTAEPGVLETTTRRTV